MRFKELADKKHDIFDEDLYALVSDDAMTLHEHYKLLSLTAHSETGETPHASIVIAEEGRESRAESEGSGPVDAIFRAIEKILSSGAELQLFSVNAITSGTDSQGEVTVRLQKSGPHRQRERRRYRHCRSLCQSLSQRAQQASQQTGARPPASVGKALPGGTQCSLPRGGACCLDIGTR